MWDTTTLWEVVGGVIMVGMHWIQWGCYNMRWEVLRYHRECDNEVRGSRKCCNSVGHTGRWDDATGGAITLREVVGVLQWRGKHWKTRWHDGGHYKAMRGGGRATTPQEVLKYWEVVRGIRRVWDAVGGKILSSMSTHIWRTLSLCLGVIYPTPTLADALW